MKLNKELEKLVGLIATPNHWAEEPEFFLFSLTIHSVDRNNFFEISS